MCAFPTLKDGGGYELLRVSGSGARSTLHVIAEGYSVPYLTEVVLQKDLKLTIEIPIAPESVSHQVAM